MKIEVGHVNEEILDEFLKGFFPEDSIQTRAGNKIREGLTVAELQGLILSGSSKDDIIEYCYA